MLWTRKGLGRMSSCRDGWEYHRQPQDKCSPTRSHPELGTSPVLCTSNPDHSAFYPYRSQTHQLPR